MGEQRLVSTSFLSQNYVMRNAVLAAMAEMVLQVLNGDQLEEAARDTRDQFLDTLQAHGHDVSSFVRSRVLQLFTRIVQQKVNRTAFYMIKTYSTSLCIGQRKEESSVKENICPKEEPGIQVATTTNKGLPPSRARMSALRTIPCLN